MDVRKTFTPKKPCARGHNLRYIAGGCVECKALYGRNNREKIIEWRKTKHYPKYFSTPDGRVSKILNNARKRAAAHNIPFNITKLDIDIPDRCPALGIPLSFGVKILHDGSPSLDRIVPDLGYISGNVSVISHRANTIKNSSNPEELRKIADWLEKRLTEMGR